MAMRQSSPSRPAASTPSRRCCARRPRRVTSREVAVVPITTPRERRWVGPGKKFGQSSRPAPAPESVDFVVVQGHCGAAYSGASCLRVPAASAGEPRTDPAVHPSPIRACWQRGARGRSSADGDNCGHEDFSRSAHWRFRATGIRPAHRLATHIDRFMPVLYSLIARH